MISRGVSAFIGGFTALNLAGELLVNGFGASDWLIDLRPLPPVLAVIVLSLVGAALLAFAFWPKLVGRSRHILAAMLLVAASFALANAVGFFRLIAKGRIHSSFPVPMSLFVLFTLTWISWRIARPVPLAGTSSAARRMAIGFFISAIAFSLAQIFCFGSTDYRRAGDVAVVFGARAYADGRPSQALADRVRTACELYHQGYAKMLIFSGGPGDGAISEPEAMQRQAVSLGVPNDAIRLDSAGLNTEATVRNTISIFRGMHVHRILAVSHGYHLPRVKIAYRQAGFEVYTVPARETRHLRGEPLLVLREVPAIWAYYGHPLVHN